MTRENPRGPRFDFDPEIERTQKQLKRRIRSLMEVNRNNGQPPADGQGLPAQADGAIAPPIPQMNQQLPARTVRDYLAKDLEGLNPAVTMPDFEAEHFELKPIMFNMLNTLGQFGGTPNENARQHLKSFLEICNSFKIHGVSNDVLKLKLFPYSLRDKAKTWLNNLQPGSLQSWTQLCRSFLAKNEDIEAMHEAWERYRDLFRRCPMHGLLEWTQVSIFYNSVNTPKRMMLDASANGTLLDKPPRESLEILDKLAQNDYQHPTSRRGNTSLTNTVKNMQKQPHIQEVKALDALCDQCRSNHDASECGQQVESSYYVGNYNKNTMSNTYNPAWRNHPNFSWKNQNNTLNPQQSTQTGFQNQPRQNPQPLPRQEFQQPTDYKNMENTLTQFMSQTSAYMARTDRFIQKTDAFMDRTKMKLQNHDATLKSLETQVGQISQILSSRPFGGFPSDTEVAKGATHEQCKAICDPGASINLMPKSVFQKLGIGEAKPTTVMLQLADHSYVQPEGKIEHILVQVEEFIFPADFLILDCETNTDAPIILGRPFLATGRVLFDFGNEELIFRMLDRLARKQFYCFLDGYSGYKQIAIAPEDQ
ncbi:hypothetical protein GQ457_01G023120 [Hibiscus cannabinus]